LNYRFLCIAKIVVVSKPMPYFQKKWAAYLPEGSSLIGVIMQTDSLVVLLASYAADWIIPAVISA
jgi:hypothetical protein